MMAMNSYSGFDAEFISMPCRNIVPKPLQKPQPPLWVARYGVTFFTDKISNANTMSDRIPCDLILTQSL